VSERVKLATNEDVGFVRGRTYVGPVSKSVEACARFRRVCDTAALCVEAVGQLDGLHAWVVAALQDPVIHDCFVSLCPDNANVGDAGALLARIDP
jgi:hypothetical protein